MLLYQMTCRAVLIALLALPLGSTGQVTVDAPIQLSAAEDALRQVTGLSLPASPSEAVSVAALRSGTLHTVEYTEGNWSILVDSDLLPLSMGTSLSILIGIPAGDGPLTLLVNGTGPYPVRYGTDIDLSASSITAGSIINLVFDGAVFQVMNRPADPLRPCPTGTVAVTDQLCMDMLPAGTLVGYYGAAQACGARGLRLCSWGEYVAGCDRRVQLGITALGQYEWTSSTCNEDGYARVVGLSACISAGCSAADGSVQRAYRCCTER
jgi:hypothetical protein